MCKKLILLSMFIVLAAFVGNAQAALLGQWNFDNSNANDSSGNNRHGTLTGGATIVTDAERGKVVSLDGVDDWVLITGYRGILGTNPRTVCAWIKTSVNNRTQGIIGWGKNSSNQKWDFTVYNSKLRQMAYLRDRTGSITVADGNWHHVASVWAGGTSNYNTVKLYIDGVLDTSITGDSSTAVTTTSDKEVRIGDASYGTDRRFNGMIDDARIYDTALSHADIRVILGQLGAYNFSPANGTLTLTTVLLDWDSAATSPKYDVYFSSDFNDVNDRDPGALVGDGISQSSYETGTLPLDTPYYWAVDVDVSGTIYPSDVRNFATAKPYAYNPWPVDEAKYVGTALSELSWTVSGIMTSQDVYFGTDFDDVNSRDAELLVADDTTDSSVALGGALDADQTYYWLVDTNSPAGIDSLGVWSFTTAASIPESSLVAWWKMDEDNARCIWDYSGYGHHAAKVGVSSIVSDAERGNVINFPGGAGNYLNAGGGDGGWATFTGSMTYCAWFKVDTFTKNVQCLIGTNGSYRLSRTGLTNTLRVYNDPPLQSSMGGTSNVNDGKWHHGCGVVDNAAGTTTTVSLYVDGILESSATSTGTIKPLVGDLIIGGDGIGDGGAYANREWDGQADDIRIYNRALSGTEVRVLAGKLGAYNFSPAYGAANKLSTVLLDWDSAAVSPKYDVYLSSDFNDVNDSVPSALKADGITDSSFSAEGLAFDTTYYWAVDVNDDGTMYYADTIMSFSTAKVVAYNPSPVNGAKYISTTTGLSWTASSIMESQDVYFGTDFDDVNSRDAGLLVADDTTDESVALWALTDGVTYYWLVDTTSDEGVKSQGVWSFTAAAIVDPNLIGWWKFDDDAAAYAWDYSGYGHPGTMVNTTFVDGKLGGKALNFVRANKSYVNIPAASAAFSALSTQVTISLWSFGGTALPVDNSVFYGDNGTNRILNSHLPFGSGSVYWDAGLVGTSYDRIYKAATADQYKGQWNHWAFTKNATAGEMKVYLNGSLWHSGTGKTKSMTGITRFTIGAVAGGASSYYDGIVDDFRVYKKALSQAEIQAIILGSSAYDFVPANGTVTPTTTVLLNWSCLAESPSYDVYLGTNSTDVTNRAGATLIDGGNQTEPNYQASGLDWDTTYYWAVDVNDEGAIFASGVKNFKTAKLCAENPLPASGVKYAAPTELSWTASTIMTSQDVYFGTDFDDVNNRNAGALVADDTTASSYTLGALVDGETYYWLVDTTTSGGVNSLGVWNFTATTTIAEPNLVGWWKMDDPAGPWDYSGYGHYGTFMGDAAISNDPNRGNVLVIDGNATDKPYVKINDFDYTNSSNECSLGFWFRNDPLEDYLPYMFNHGSGEAYAWNNLDVYGRNTTESSPGCLTSRIILDGPAGEVAPSASRWQKNTAQRSDDGQWHYYTVTLSTTGAKVYVDGVVTNSGTVPGLGNPLNPTQDILLGARDMLVGGVPTIDRFFDGMLDDVRLYNKALSQEEVWALAGVDPVLDTLQDVIDNWLTAGPSGNLNGDSIVNLRDFNIAVQQWGWED